MNSGGVCETTIEVGFGSLFGCVDWCWGSTGAGIALSLDWAKFFAPLERDVDNALMDKLMTKDLDANGVLRAENSSRINPMLGST